MSPLLACRLCLTVNARMFTIANTPFQEIYERLTNIQLQNADGRPTMACHICLHLLKRSRTFIEKSVKADELLREILFVGSELTPTSLSALDTGKLQMGLAASPTVFTNFDPSDGPAETRPHAEHFEIKVEALKTEEAFDSVEDPLQAQQPPSPWMNEEICMEPISMSNSEGRRVHPSRIKRETKGPRKRHNAVAKKRKNSKRSDITKKSQTEDKLISKNFMKYLQGDCHEMNGKINQTASKTRTGEKQFHCGHCSKAFYLKGELTTHMSVHTGVKPHHCNHCTKTFRLKFDLTKHIRTHTGEKPYRCEHCSKAFNLRANLTRHIRTHTGEKPYRCSHCNKAFNQKSTLTTHVRTHTGEKPYLCSHCSKAFNHKRALIMHIRVHTGEKPYRCNLCSKAFNQKNTLTSHIRRHTGEKPYLCSHCSKAFNDKRALMTHTGTHTGEKQHRCNHCSKTFNDRSNLSRHLKTHTGEKPYQCSLCSKAFNQKTTLTNHIRTHTGEKPYLCSHCSKAFSDKSHFNTHIRTHTRQ